MAKFKVGDRVRAIESSGGGAVTKGQAYVVDGLEWDDVRFVNNYGRPDRWRADHFEPVTNDNSPIRIVIRREIVPGTYGIVEIGAGNHVYIDEAPSANDLRAAAALFDEIANVLDENAKSGEVV